MQPPDLESLRLLRNNIPLDDFCGLTPNEMHHLLCDTFGKKSPIQIQKDVSDEVLYTVPFLRLTEEYIKMIEREDQVKLTPKGALPRKVIDELYGHRLILEDAIESGIVKLTRMTDSVVITSLFINTGLAGLTKTRRGRLSVTKEGAKCLLQGQRNDLFHRTVQSFTSTFNWGNNDGFGQHPTGQLGWGYTVYLLTRFGDQRQTMQFYADKYLKAFPKLIDYFTPPIVGSPQEQFTACYALRTFDRFLDWFGFVDVEPHRHTANRSTVQLTRSETLAMVFQVS